MSFHSAPEPIQYASQTAPSVPPPPYSAAVSQALPASAPPGYGAPQTNGFPNEKQQYQNMNSNVSPQMGQPSTIPIQQQQQFQSMGGMMAQQQPFHQQQMNPQDQQQAEMLKMLQNMPPEKLQALQQQFMSTQQQQFGAPPAQQPIYGMPPTATGSYIPQPCGVPPAPAKPEKLRDEKKSGKVKRFMGDTLVGRFARAGVQSCAATMKMPTALSPWGDNNPVTLPNVRYRDAVLFTTFAFVGAPLVEGADSFVTDIFGADSFVSEIVSSGAGFIVGSTVVKYGVFQIVEQAIDKGVLEHMLPEEEKMIQTTNVKSLQVGIKHKLMGVDADLRFAGVYKARDEKACAKGWLCPYLFASARTPLVPRVNDFAVAQFFGPFVGADYAMAHKLISESSHVLPLCDPDPTHTIQTPEGHPLNRMVVVFTGIAPYRAGMWSTSRRPGCGTIIFHLLDGCPALVLPVNNRAPILAWSPWTLAQMRNPMASGYTPEWQHEQICEWLDSVVAVEYLSEGIRDRYVDVLGRMVSLVINGALALDRIETRTVIGKVDAERAGIVMFRY